MSEEPNKTEASNTPENESWGKVGENQVGIESGEEIRKEIKKLSEDPIEHNPITRADDVDTEVAHLRRVSRFLDNSMRVPGTNYRFGADPIIGALPIAGDVVSSIFSLYIIYKSYLLGISKGTIARMTINIVIDTVVGILPVIGDLIDSGWKANKRNVDLLEKRGNELGPSKRDKWFAIAFVISPILLVLMIIILTFGAVIAII